MLSTGGGREREREWEREIAGRCTVGECEFKRPSGSSYWTGIVLVTGFIIKSHGTSVLAASGI